MGRNYTKAVTDAPKELAGDHGNADWHSVMSKSALRHSWASKGMAKKV